MATPTTDGPFNLFAVNGQVSVITGGGTGLGYMMAKALESAGAKKVYILGRRKDVLLKAAEGSSVLVPIQCDVTSKEDLIAAAKQVEEEEGYIDLLVNNSGVSGPSHKAVITLLRESGTTIEQIREELLKDEPKDWATTFAINITAVMTTTAAFLVLLDKGNKRRPSSDTEITASSQIITVSSVAAFSRSAAFSFAYNASKAAVTHMSKMLSTSLANFNIRSNIIAPGLYPSEMNVATKLIGIDPKVVPEGRFGTTEDMTGTILFMASRAGAYLNGMVMLTDGGRVSVFPAVY